MENQSSLVKALVAAASIVIIFAGIKAASEIVVPFLLALFIAIICSPSLNYLTKKKVPYGVAIGLLLVFILVVFFFLFGLINNTIQEFSQSIPQYRQLLGERVNSLVAFTQNMKIPVDISEKTIMENFDPSVIMNFVRRVFLSFSGVVTNTFVLLLVVIFMLLEAPYAKHKFAVVLSSNPNEIGQQERYLDRMLQGVISYLGVKTMMSLLTGVCIWLLLEILGVQYAILWATLSFLLNYIPNIGSIIAAIPIIVQALLLNGFVVGLEVIVGVVAINMIIGNVLEPRLMGKKLGISTLVVFLSLLFWGWLLGTVGMLLSVPLTMALKIALEAGPTTAKYALLLGDSDNAADN
ncbi:AI-2E family transporter [Aggregatibacter actinomycetemcomitans]|nr:AI-2E family transporter [Aggregatibacter actinomycetemcomitans]